MKDKRKSMKKMAQRNVMVKISARYPCSSNGTRRPCPQHCKKCFYEEVYCCS